MKQTNFAIQLDQSMDIARLALTVGLCAILLMWKNDKTFYVLSTNAIFLLSELSWERYVTIQYVPMLPLQ